MSGEAFVEEELAEMDERGERDRVEGGVGSAARVWGVVGDEAEVELSDVDGGVFGRVVADDAVWGGARVVGEEGTPGEGGVDGGEDVIDGFLFG